MKVFFASPYWKMWKFSCRKGIRNNTHFQIDTCEVRVLRTYTPYLFECGVLYRLSSTGSFHNLPIDERKSAPHFLFLFIGLRGDARLADWICRIIMNVGIIVLNGLVADITLVHKSL